MAESNVESVSCGVDDKRNQLSYDRSAKELASCKNKDFSFQIQAPDDGKSVALFEIHKDGAVVRRNTSKPFPAGALVKKEMSVNKQNCNVILKNPQNLSLNEYF